LRRSPGGRLLQQSPSDIEIWSFAPPLRSKDIIQAFYDGIKHEPDTTFGNVEADVIADKEPNFHPGNFCSVIRRSAWAV
jgi:hypothetical protein